MEQKFKKGDKCRIVKYGVPFHQSKTQYQQFLDADLSKKDKPDNILFEDDDYYVVDMAPELVGQECEIHGSWEDLYGGHKIPNEFHGKTKATYSTSLFAWANENQLELI